MGWINSRQQERDHNGQRNVCAADGREGTTADPLALDDEGYRVHRSHFTDENSGLYGRQQVAAAAHQVDDDADGW